MAKATKRTTTPKAKKSAKRVTTTVGEMIAAAWEATNGQVERAARLMQDGPLADMSDRRILFV